MGLYTNIESALNTQLSTLSASPPIAWPNTDYEPILGIAYIRPTLMPASGTLNTLAGSYLNIGLYQIDVFVPINRGVGVLDSWLDALFILFAGKTLTANGQNVFVQDVVQGKSNRQDGWYAGNITIHYQAHS